MTNYPQTYFKSLIIQTKELTKKLKNLDSNYHLDINPISVNKELPINLHHNHNLVDLFRNELNIKIQIEQISQESYIKAFIMQYEGESKIYTTLNNACWTRFYICKELSQMLIFSEANTTCTNQDIEELLSHILNKIADPSNPKISADLITILSAIEFLIPSDIVDGLLALQQKGFSNNQIAKKMLVPEKIVDFRLSIKGQEFFNN